MLVALEQLAKEGFNDVEFRKMKVTKNKSEFFKGRLNC